GAELQAANLLGLRAMRRDHDDRYPAELAEPFDELPAVESGQRDVEDHQVGMLIVEPAEPIGPGSSRHDAVAGPGHPQLHELGEFGLVLDDEDRLRHRQQSRRAPQPWLWR